MKMIIKKTKKTTKNKKQKQTNSYDLHCGHKKIMLKHNPCLKTVLCL